MAELRSASEMKDSGIEWVGQIPNDWEKAKLKYLGSYINGFAFKPEDWTGKGKPIIRIQDLTGSNAGDPNYYDGELEDKYLVHSGDILVSWAATLDAFVWNKGEGWLNQHIFKAIPVETINRHYFLWLLKVTMDNMNNDNKHGIVMQHVTTGVFNNYQIPLAPLAEQQAIANYLDDRCSKIDEIIAEATASIEEYKELKQAVIFEAVTKGLDKNAPMKDSGVVWIGKIPANWALVRIPRILDYSDIYPLGDGDHGMIKTEDYLSEGIPYIRVQNLGWGTDLLLDNVVYISEDNNNKIKNSQLKPNDVLFCKTGGTIGKTGIVPIDLPISNTTSHVGKITVNPVYNPRYVFYVLSSNVGYRQFWEIACQKTTRPELSIAETRQIRLTWPSCRKEQDDIVQYLDAIVPEYEALISEKQSLIEDLQAYKKSLIYEVVTGKRRVV